jgi:Type I phosphodiesterase / nucleotide pyrophosphatase
MRSKVLLAAVVAMCVAAAPSVALAHHDRDHHGRHAHGSKHVLLISVDGLHASDLRKWIAAYPNSTLAQLSARGTTYNDALTTLPSDSSPGMAALATGGTPKTTGIYYDDSYDRSLYAPQNKTCSGPAGTETFYAEPVDYDQTKLNGGVSAHNSASVSPDNVPRRKNATRCVPVLPNQFLRVNTIFDVIHNAGLRTAWSDKHPSYQLLNGPEPNAIDDLYTPEINSNADPSIPGPAGGDWTSSEPRVIAYDSLKVNAVVDEINGKSSYCVDEPAKCSSPGTPAIMGMNFQAVSVGQKLPDPNSPVSPADGLPYIGGEAAPGSGHPFNTNLQDGLQFVDSSLGQMMQALQNRGLLRSTEVIITAKHGQSPVNPNKLTRANPDDFNAVVKRATGAQFPDPTTGLGQQASTTTDDVGVIWLSKPFQNKAESMLAAFATPTNYHKFDIRTIISGDRLQREFGDPATDPCTPDAIVLPNEGGLYSLSSKKVAEHGGGSHDDRKVALLVINPKDQNGGRSDDTRVTTTQVAPTILQYLGLKPWALDSVRIEGTQTLPAVQ